MVGSPPTTSEPFLCDTLQTDQLQTFSIDENPTTNYTHITGPIVTAYRFKALAMSSRSNRHTKCSTKSFAARTNFGNQAKDFHGR